MLAYSAVAHAGYLLVALVTDNPLARQGLVFYILAYSVMTVGAFTVVMALEGPHREGHEIREFAGLAKTHPMLAAVLALCLMSLGGVPPTVGFFGKAVVFGAAIQAGGWFLALALIGVLTSVLAIFYYFRIIVQMYMNTTPALELEEGKASRLVGKPALSLSFVLLLAVVGTLGLSLLAGVSLDWAKDAANSIVGLVQTH
jgi:NADH-quinone oxidoreductase subunit N